jgi:hypothetical protein
VKKCEVDSFVYLRVRLSYQTPSSLGCKNVPCESTGSRLIWDLAPFHVHNIPEFIIILGTKTSTE